MANQGIDDILNVMGAQRAISLPPSGGEATSLEALSQRLGDVVEALRQRDQVALPVPADVSVEVPGDELLKRLEHEVETDWDDTDEPENFVMRRNDDEFRTDGIDSSNQSGVKSIVGRDADADDNDSPSQANGEWYWFVNESVNTDQGVSADLFPAGCTGAASLFFPEMPACTITKVRAVAFSPTANAGITSGSATLLISLRHGTQADVRADGDVDTWTNVGPILGLGSTLQSDFANVADAGALPLSLTTGQALGAYVAKSAVFTHSDNPFSVYVGVYVEEN